ELWRRDRHCTFPGCDAPAMWSRAHHVVHWADGGPSDLSNAALLCQRHHTLVHERRLIAVVHPPDVDGRCVTWDLSPGSYDRCLPERLTDLRRARARQGQRERARARRVLDTGPSTGRCLDLPDDVLLDLVDDLIAHDTPTDPNTWPHGDTWPEGDACPEGDVGTEGHACPDDIPNLPHSA
ncbi:HNH endonuclease, partial [Knoellia remsis]